MRTAESLTVIFSKIGNMSSRTIHFSRHSNILPMHTNELTRTLSVCDSRHSFLILGISWCFMVCVSSRLVNEGIWSKHNSCISTVSDSNARHTIGRMCSFTSVDGVFDSTNAMFLNTMSKICTGFCSLKMVFKPGKMYLTNSSDVDWSAIRNIFGNRKGIMSGLINSCSRHGIMRCRQTLLIFLS